MMKKLFLFFFSFSCLFAMAQPQTFDITIYTTPKGWKKESTLNAIQFTKENTTTGTYCAITLFKSLPASANAKENFDLTWTSVVKEMIPVSTPPEMQPPETEDGWEAQSGYAAFETDGNKGIALLVTSTGFEKMVNILILTNSDVYENEITDFLGSIDFKKQNPVATKQPLTPVNNTKPVTSAKKDGFAFTTTNFDDGWISTVQEDWVEVTKGNIKVLIHYPNKKADEYNSVLKESDYTAWNTLVAPRYSNLKNLEWKTIQSWQSITFMQGEAKENATGKFVHIVFFKKHYSTGRGQYLEFVTDNKATYEKEFGAYLNTELDWDKTANMQFRNKFAVAASDLKGKWSNNFTGMTQYVNAYTGASAGADTHASNQSFEFGAGSTYKWSIGIASGFVGNIKFQSAKSNGKFSVPNNWQVNFSDIEGKPKTYPAQFSCIKGARILWLDDTGFGKAE